MLQVIFFFFFMCSKKLVQAVKIYDWCSVSWCAREWFVKLYYERQELRAITAMDSKPLSEEYQELQTSA